MLTPGSIVSQPFHGKVQESLTDEDLDIFVLMTFSDDLKPVYEKHIKHVSELLSLKVKRADDFFTSNAVMQDVWTGICSSRVIIADCTKRNPNVFYEIGLAHAIGKPIILITQNIEDVPFDLRHIRFIQYHYSQRGMKAFELRLMTTIKAGLDPRAVKKLKPAPCPFCGSPLRTQSAKQCRYCMRDWHEPNQIVSLAPCPFCGETLRTFKAKQCRFCLKDWHDPNNVILRAKREVN